MLGCNFPSPCLSPCVPLLVRCPDKCLSPSFPLFPTFAPVVLCLLCVNILKIFGMLHVRRELEAQRHNLGLRWLMVADTGKVSGSRAWESQANQGRAGEEQVRSV